MTIILYETKTALISGIKKKIDKTYQLMSYKKPISIETWLSAVHTFITLCSQYCIHLNLKAHRFKIKFPDHKFRLCLT